MKDFYDLWLLARQFSFEGPVLLQTIYTTFDRRRISLPSVVPLALTMAFYGDPSRQAMWRSFLKNNQLLAGEQDFGKVAQCLRSFLMPPVEALTHGDAFNDHWPVGGLWTKNSEDEAPG